MYKYMYDVYKWTKLLWECNYYILCRIVLKNEICYYHNAITLKNEVIFYVKILALLFLHLYQSYHTKHIIKNIKCIYK